MFFALTGAAWAGGDGSGDGVTVEVRQGSPRPETEQRHPGAGGVRAYLDPQTGKLLDSPPAGGAERVLELTWREQTAVARSYADLPTYGLPGGGKSVDLLGRFQSLGVATKSDAGVVGRWCHTPRPGLRGPAAEGAP